MPSNVSFPAPPWMLTIVLVLGLLVPGAIDALLTEPSVDPAAHTASTSTASLLPEPLAPELADQEPATALAVVDPIERRGPR